MANQFFLPIMGSIFDRARIEAAGGVERLEQLGGAELDNVLRIASAESFQAVAAIPMLLLPVFGLIWLNDRRRKSAVAPT
jgi:hypothetical protein